jgi:hypothetical protein
MPVTYIASETIAAGNTTRGIVLGLIEGIDLTGYTAGTEVFVAAGGGWTSTRPTGSAIVQILGIVTKDGAGGKGLVLNPGPVELPNLQAGYAWVGDANGVPQAVPTASLLVSSASYALNSTSASFATFASTAGSATSATSATSALTASFVNRLSQQLVVTGSVRGEVKALSISSNTASLDCSVDNFFTLTLVSGSDTLVNPTNINPGQTVNVLISPTGSGTVSFPSNIKQASGSAYVATTGEGTLGKDVITFITFDGTNVYLSSVKNMI